MAKKEDGDPPGEAKPGVKPVDAPAARRRQDALGRRLQQLWDEVVEEGAPDDWLTILKDIDQKGGAQGGEKKAGKPGPGGKGQ